MTDSPLKALAALIAEADKADGLPLGLQAAERLLLLRRFRNETLRLIEYHGGYADQHQTLVSLVYELLGTVTAHSNGRTHWASEVPHGTAPQFRRALNNLIRHLDADTP